MVSFLTEIKLFFVQTSSSRLYIVLIHFLFTHSLVHWFMPPSAPSPTVFVIVRITFWNHFFLLYVRVFLLLFLLLLYVCIIIRLQCKALFKCPHWKTAKSNQEYFIHHSFKHGESAVFIFYRRLVIEFVHCHTLFLPFIFLFSCRHSFFCHFVFLLSPHPCIHSFIQHIALEHEYQNLSYHVTSHHITQTLFFICLLPLFSLSLFSHFICKHLCRRHARSLFFVSDLDFVCADRAFLLSTSVCLFDWSFFFSISFLFFSACSFLFLSLSLSLFFQDK